MTLAPKFQKLSKMLSPSESIIHHVDTNSSKKSFLHDGAEQLAGSEFNFFGSDLELAMYEHQSHQRLQQFAEFGNSDDIFPHVESSRDAMLNQHKDKTTNTLPFQILHNHGTRHFKTDAEKSTFSSGSTLSTNAIIELASRNFIQSTTCLSQDELSILSHPYPGSLFGISKHDLKGVELIQDLLSCAEKVSENQYERARKLLRGCHLLSSLTGSPIQRLVYYFVEALYERIGNETGRAMSSNKKIDPLEVLNWPNTNILTLHKEHPLPQIAQFVGTQVVVEHVADASMVHVIDFDIRSGVQCITLMQALASRCENPIQHLKVSAVGTKSKPVIEDTGRRLRSFAHSLNLNFSFNVVMVDDMLDLNESLFELDDNEAVVVYAAYALTRIVGRGNRLENMMEVLKSINPCIMIVVEIESNCNNPNFVGRFVEGLFYYGAYFDSLGDCMKNSEKIREDIESKCFRFAIINLLTAEGEERKIRHVSINVWRAFFERCGLVETQLSESCFFHANLVLQRFACQGSCTLTKDGKCLTIGWKGTPLSSLSAWKFQ